MIRKRNHPAIFLIIILCFSVFTGCQEIVGEEEIIVDIKTAVLENMAAVTSVETNIGLEMKAHIGAQGAANYHTASLGSDITLQMTADPLATHGEYYSRIVVDGESTRDDKEFYIIENGPDMLQYDYVNDDEWNVSTLTKAEALAVPCQTGLIYDWNTFLSHLTDENLTETINDKTCFRFSGDVPATLLQEFFGDKVFGSFMYSTEMLLGDMIPCVLYIDCETYFPEQVVLDFTHSFIVSDMTFDTAAVCVTYSKWNSVPDIEIPKKVDVVAVNTDAEFYSSYYAWNLFLPYIRGEETVGSDPQVGSSGLSFAADWSTFQVRIDGNMTKLPILYSDMEKAGYSVDTIWASSVVEPNKYIENVLFKKGMDSLNCTVYNPDAVAQPITNCYIGAIDLSAGNNPTSGIALYLPGEVCLGISREALVSAYGEPDVLETGFAADTYTWNGSTEKQVFLAEVSPINNLVIRICLKNIPVPGVQK